eukprot:scaffold205779_cov24-Tisochrysis_lutea.AAC.1
MSPGTHNGFPLRIEVEQMEEVEAEFNAEFTARMVAKIEYKALIDTVASVSAAQPDRSPLPGGARQPASRSVSHLHLSLLQLNVDSKLPAALPEDYATNEEFLQALHHVLLEIEIVTGTLVCPETGKRFAIKDGIPSML